MLRHTGGLPALWHAQRKMTQVGACARVLRTFTSMAAAPVRGCARVPAWCLRVAARTPQPSRWVCVCACVCVCVCVVGGGGGVWEWVGAGGGGGSRNQKKAPNVLGNVCVPRQLGALGFTEGEIMSMLWCVQPAFVHLARPFQVPASVVGMHAAATAVPRDCARAPPATPRRRYCCCSIAPSSMRWHVQPSAGLTCKVAGVAWRCEARRAHAPCWPHTIQAWLY